MIGIARKKETSGNWLTSWNAGIENNGIENNRLYLFLKLDWLITDLNLNIILAQYLNDAYKTSVDTVIHA